MALYHRGFRRDASALLISLCVHLFLLILFGFWMASQTGLIGQQETIAVDLLQWKDKPPAMRRRPPKTLRIPPPLTAEPLVQAPQPQTPNVLAETLRQASRQVRYDATFERDRPLTDRLPTLTTAAENLRATDAVRLARSMSSRKLPRAGEGMTSFRQRVGGSGTSRLTLSEPAQVAEIEIPSEKIGLEPTSAPPTADQLSPFGEALFRIGEHIAQNSTTGTVDVVFVIDTSKSMQDNVAKVAENLYHMTDTFDRQTFDYRLGVVEFSVRNEGNRIVKVPMTRDPAILQKRMKRLRVSGDEHALDALVNTLNTIEFRGSADKHLILVTDEPASTGWNAPDAYTKLRKQILDTCRRQGIVVNVLGYDENFQHNLATLTGGLWQEIPGGQRGSPASAVVPSTEALFRIFRDIARRIGQASPQGGAVDVVLVVDYSGSMATKASAITNGVEVLRGMLERYPVDVQYGMIRFAEQPENLGGIRGSVVSQIPIDPERLTRLLAYPFVGDEHLLDTIVQALPRIAFRPDAAHVIVILTDEPSTGSVSAQEAIRVCQGLGVQVHVIGYVPTGLSMKQLAEDEPIRTGEFQVLAAVQTKGAFYPMPGALARPDPAR